MKNTPHNLVMSALYGGRRGERPPAGNPTSIICHALMDAAGVGFPEAHQDAGAMATLALTGYEVAGFDTVMPEFSVQQEAEALGCKVDWGHRDMMPDVKESPCKDFHNVEVPHDLLKNRLCEWCSMHCRYLNAVSIGGAENHSYCWILLPDYIDSRILLI